MHKITTAGSLSVVINLIAYLYPAQGTSATRIVNSDSFVCSDCGAADALLRVYRDRATWGLAESLIVDINVPLNSLRGVGSFSQVEATLYPQFEAICVRLASQLSWTPVECAKDLISQALTHVAENCAAKEYFTRCLNETSVESSQANITRILAQTARDMKKLLSSDFITPCVLRQFGRGFGGHELCEDKLEKGCLFYSFGVGFDYSFDSDLGDRGCFGYAFDPTVSHPTAITKGVQFMQVAASSLGNNNWITVTTIPALKQWLRHTRISVLKMDCEGCEYALARDVFHEDRHFFNSIDQFAVEIHMPQFFMASFEHVKNYALLLSLLEEAKLYLTSAVLTPCSPAHESSGCHPLVIASGYPCFIGGMCQNLLFSRYR